LTRASVDHDHGEPAQEFAREHPRDDGLADAGRSGEEDSATDSEPELFHQAAVDGDGGDVQIYLGPHLFGDNNVGASDIWKLNGLKDEPLVRGGGQCPPTKEAHGATGIVHDRVYYTRGVIAVGGSCVNLNAAGVRKHARIADPHNDWHRCELTSVEERRQHRRGCETLFADLDRTPRRRIIVATGSDRWVELVDQRRKSQARSDVADR
jgi:hypothetical protein